MELIYLSCFNAIAVFLIINKWKLFGKKPKVCIFCLLGWASIAESLITFISAGDYLYIPCQLFSVWVFSIVAYFFTKNSFE